MRDDKSHTMKSRAGACALVVFALFLLSAGGAASARTPEARAPMREPFANYAGWAEGYWGFAPVGDFLFEVKEDEDSYHLNVHLYSQNPVKRFTKYWSKTRVDGIKRPRDSLPWEPEDAPTAYDYIPQTYTMHYNLKKWNRKVTLHYDAEGNNVEREYSWEENRHKRPDVPQEQRNVPDMLTAALIARSEILRNPTIGRTFSVPYYDGRRRGELTFVIHGPTRETIRSDRRDVFHVSFTRRPVAGFTNNEHEAMKTQEPRFDVFFSDDAHFIPTHTFGQAPAGDATITLRRRCRDMEDCLRVRD